MPVPHVGGTPTVDASQPGIVMRKVTLIGADSFDWSPDSKEIQWSLGASTFRIRAESVTLQTGEASASAKDLAPKTADFVIEMPRAQTSGIVALRGATAITMRGHEVLQNAELVINRNRIAAKR